MKTLRKIGLLIILALFLFLLTNGEYHFWLYPHIDTVFSENFSLSKFEKVENGMTKDEVKNILGYPLLTDYRGCWQYSTDGKAWPLDYSWFAYLICFDGEDLVVRKEINEFSD